MSMASQSRRRILLSAQPVAPPGGLSFEPQRVSEYIAQYGVNPLTNNAPPNLSPPITIAPLDVPAHVQVTFPENYDGEFGMIALEEAFAAILQFTIVQTQGDDTFAFDWLLVVSKISAETGNAAYAYMWDAVPEIGVAEPGWYRLGEDEFTHVNAAELFATPAILFQTDDTPAGIFRKFVHEI
jgi:hypothetical protein